ncbi:IS1182 family transposase [Paraburkholderia sabiae]|uniref:IS1182 family transposase n=1 Tax=Paraburkholderia sabiae TaxID=273251 RepID=A0ABU9QSX9_9BURK|nr:IS1182 family transposase [Paraburkholderia sabiae]WJZ79574.1 IS1182 family transposase [Paraburkholderia sabiae]CAD6563437.1 IS1182 family transposase ISBusp4 [Paraburkholderia sabiae]
MKRFVEGDDRKQVAPLPECVDDYIGQDNPVRAIDAFADELNLAELGFNGTTPALAGRPPYHPGVMLKIYIYGYLNRVPSSRRLERECQRNVELMWLTGRLAPDFKTIADFRRDNGPAIRNVCRRFVELCRGLKLLSGDMVAIDGSKFKAVNSRDRNYTAGKIDKRQQQIEESVQRYLDMIETADRISPTGFDVKTVRLYEKIALLRQRMRELKQIREQLKKGPDKQLSLTDPDSRSMTSGGKRTGTVGYNVQTAVDTKHHLIVEHEVENIGGDHGQLSRMALSAKSAMGKQKLKVLADRGYFSGPDIRACELAGITTYVPKPLISASRKKGLFTKRDFIYVARNDEYRCPAGERAILRFRTVEKGMNLNVYWPSACPRCHLKDRCSPSDYRPIRRWEHEHVLEAMQRRLDRKPEAMTIRRSTVEHVFGTLKHWMGATHFLTRTLGRVSTEMSLQVLAYNLKRVMKILGRP